jgi:hypothetical protein
MSDERISTLITSKVVINPKGNTPTASWGGWDWKRIGPYSLFEIAAMKSQQWSDIEWVGVLACPDSYADALLIVVQDRDRKDRLKAIHATKRDTANEITLKDFQSNAANRFIGSINKWKIFADMCDKRRKENDLEPDRIFKCPKSI